MLSFVFDMEEIEPKSVLVGADERKLISGAKTRLVRCLQ